MPICVMTICQGSLVDVSEGRSIGSGGWGERCVSVCLGEKQREGETSIANNGNGRVSTSQSDMRLRDTIRNRLRK